MDKKNKILKKIKIKRIIKFSVPIFFIIIILMGLMQQNLKLTTYEITSQLIPIQFDGYKIIHISDFHSGLFNGSAEDIIKMTAKQNPNIICLTGDIVDGRTQDFTSVEYLVSGLSKIAPTYAVSGNNEHYEKSIIKKTKEIYDKYGVNFIDDKKITIYNGDVIMTILGIADPGGDDSMLDREVLTKNDYYNTEGFGIILYHRANEFEKLIDMGYNLVLSGHLHGGLIRIPFIGGMFSPYNEFFPKYSGGLYKKKDVYLISSKGIGNNHPIPRIFNPPETVLIILHPEN